MTPFEWIQTISSIATAVGVIVAARQLQHAKGEAQSQVEDGYTEQYRQIAGNIPLEALLGKDLSDAEVKAHLRAFYEYFDLCNEQAFIAGRGHVRRKTWENWREGILQHMARPGFKTAWSELSRDLEGSFDDFKRLLASAAGDAAPVGLVEEGTSRREVSAAG